MEHGIRERERENKKEREIEGERERGWGGTVREREFVCVCVFVIEKLIICYSFTQVCSWFNKSRACPRLHATAVVCMQWKCFCTASGHPWTNGGSSHGNKTPATLQKPLKSHISTISMFCISYRSEPRPLRNLSEIPLFSCPIYRSQITLFSLFFQGDPMYKSTFLVFFQGEQLKGKVKKICEG